MNNIVIVAIVSGQSKEQLLFPLSNFEVDLGKN